MLHEIRINVFEIENCYGEKQYRKILAILPQRYRHWIETLYEEYGEDAVKAFANEHKYDVNDLQISKDTIRNDDRGYEQRITIKSSEPFFVLCKTHGGLEIVWN